MQSNTCLIAITTPRDSEHFFSALLKMVDEKTGKPIFNVLRIGNPCEACMKTEKSWLCTHKVNELPPWKSMKKQSRYGAIYKDNQDQNLREQWGIEADKTEKAFRAEDINAFENRKFHSIEKPPDVIWLACDPAGSGASEHAISASVFIDGKMIV